MKPWHFAIAALALGASSLAAPMPALAAARPAAHDWTHTVTLSPVGGFVMGNPAATVKLIEFGSYTCPHCARFSAVVLPQLVDKYVRTGQASYEFRSAVRDRYDLVAAELARCAGPRDFFPATAALFASQQDWMEQAINYEAAHSDELSKLDGVEKAVAIARGGGLDSWFAARGLPVVRQRTCLGDQADLKKISAMAEDAFNRLDIPGTPAIYVNNALVEGGADWTKLDAAIAAALSKK